MKMIFKVMTTLFLMIFVQVAFSDRVVVTGKPVILQEHAGYYTFPVGYVTNKPYHYILFAETKRVCYLQDMPEFVSLENVRLPIEDNGKKLLWNCYKFDPRFFKIDY